MMEDGITQLVEKRRRWVEVNRENDFEAGIKRLLTELYPDSAHFIYELLQNAEDAQAEEVRFILFDDRVEFEHDGKRLFSIQDVKAITGLGISTKRDDNTNIGKFGVGFKAVFAYTETPEVKSGEFHFRIHDMVIPEPSGHTESQSINRQTRFILPFNNPKKSAERARDEIATLLRALDATTLLFLSNIRKIEYLLPDSSLGYIERFPLEDHRFKIHVQQPGQREGTPDWFLMFDNVVQVVDEEAETESQKLKSCRIAVAFRLAPVEAKAGSKERKGGDEASTPELELVPMDRGKVCIYFPAEKETSNLRFHLHAPFASTVARDSVRACDGNSMLRDHLAELLAEKMSAIRDQGLLNVRALAVLPNDKDNLPQFYKPLLNRLVKEFQEKNLVPMKQGGHAPASGVFRGPKSLSDLIDDNDLVTLLLNDYVVPMWVANPPQRHQREDNFLALLGIQEWNVADLVSSVNRMPNEAIAQWMGKKGDKWHHDFYEQLADYLNSAPKSPSSEAASRKAAVSIPPIVRVKDQTYRKGNECFFPPQEDEWHELFPLVDKKVYYTGEEAEPKIYDLFRLIGVREINEKAEIEYLLKDRYSPEAVARKAFKPDLNDIVKFISFLDKHPADAGIFKRHYIFKLRDGKWHKPEDVYLDAPFMDTNLSMYFETILGGSQQIALSDEYRAENIDPKQIGAFASNLGAAAVLPFTFLDAHTERDYIIKHIEDIVASHEMNASKLIWKASIEHEQKGVNYYQKESRRNGRGKFKPNGDSSIIDALKQHAWVPQNADKTIEFVRPCDAVAEKLPEGFTYATEWQWLKLIEFGKDVERRRETQRREQESQTVAYRRKAEAARECGFESAEDAGEMAKLRKERPDEIKKLIAKGTSPRNERPTFPIKPVINPERRMDRLCEQLTEVPDKNYEKRQRSVRATSSAIDPDTWLRNQYTNDADQMVCQICQEKMPFRRRDGQWYFEGVELFGKGDQGAPSKEHEAQYLALCPVCAAKYKEFVKHDSEATAKLRDAIIKAAGCTVPLSLGDEETDIRFVETHLQDIQCVLRSEGTEI